MAKIIYGVAGEGFGHSSRSHLIGRRLLDAGHDVMFVGSRKSLTYLKQYFAERVREIFGLSFAFEDGRIDKSETLKQNLMRIPEGNRQNDELFKRYFEPFAPDLIISDFEPFSAWWAWRNRVPFISIDHEHVLTLCELEPVKGNWFSRVTASVFTEFYYVGAVAYVLINFFKAPLRAETALLAPPVVRPVVASLTPTCEGHVVVYSTSAAGREQLIETLGRFPDYRFHVYGFDRSEETGNCLFKERSTEGFLTDLASCRGVIASAGFSLISECMYLRKKMLLLPIKGQYEQIMNAHYARKLGLGVSSPRLDESSIRQFSDELAKPVPVADDILWPDNDKCFDVVQQALNRLPMPVNLALRA